MTHQILFFAKEAKVNNKQRARTPLPESAETAGSKQLVPAQAGVRTGLQAVVVGVSGDAVVVG